jgi:hypothetical protein
MMKPPAIGSLVLALVLPLGSARAADIRTIDGALDDTVASIAKNPSGDGLVLTTQGGKSFPLDKVKEVRLSDRAPARVHDARLFLLSGDEVVGTIDDEVKAGESFKLSTVSLGTVEVTLDSVGAIFFDVAPEAEDRLAKQLLPWLLAGKGTRPEHDAFGLKGGGGSQGTVQSFSRGGLVFKDTQDTVWPTFPLKRLESLVLGGDAPKKPGRELSVRVRLLDGSVVTGAALGLKDGRLELVHPLGKKATLSIDLAQVLSFEVENGAFVYLSQLDPTEVKETFPDGFQRSDEYAWKRDREVMGGTLRLGGRAFARGIGVHSYSSLEFAVPAGSRELRATLGIDDSTRYVGASAQGLGSVVFRVLVDGKVQKEVPKTRGDTPSEIAVPVAGAQKVQLVVDYGPYMHVLGRADWADACFVP